jgi:hypothetical protein
VLINRVITSNSETGQLRGMVAENVRGAPI